MGEVIMSATGRVEHATNALQTEAVACLNALKAAGDLGADEVKVESDALCLVQALNGNGYDRASNGVLFKEIKTLSSLKFNSVSFKFGPRACNKNDMKCNKTLSKWCKNKHGASKIIDTFEMYQ
jgi:ribonuclease HI